MISLFAVIIDDEVVYASNEEEYPYFEVVVFASTLLNLLGQRKWRLHKLKLSPIKGFYKEKVLIYHVYYEDVGMDVLYCVSGSFSEGSKVGYEMLYKFRERIEKIYKPNLFREMVKNKRIIFQQICEEISYYLEENYKERIQEEKDLHEAFTGEPNLIYCGVSSQGLPIVSHIYNLEMILKDYEALDENEINNKRLLLESTISGQLATISMNSYIRAKAYVDEIQIIVDKERDIFGFINFGQIGINGMFTLELFTIGQPAASYEFFKKVRNTAENFECLQKPFMGELKPYKELKDFLMKLEFK
ncbi:MAG: hypothetical protein ACTSU2_06515 [Promethearchaeota archaeon]